MLLQLENHAPGNRAGSSGEVDARNHARYAGHLYQYGPSSRLGEIGVSRQDPLQLDTLARL